MRLMRLPQHLVTEELTRPLQLLLPLLPTMDNANSNSANSRSGTGVRVGSSIASNVPFSSNLLFAGRRSRPAGSGTPRGSSTVEASDSESTSTNGNLSTGELSARGGAAVSSRRSRGGGGGGGSGGGGAAGYAGQNGRPAKGSSKSTAAVGRTAPPLSSDPFVASLLERVFHKKSPGKAASTGTNFGSGTGTGGGSHVKTHRMLRDVHPKNQYLRVLLEKRHMAAAALMEDDDAGKPHQSQHHHQHQHQHQSVRHADFAEQFRQLDFHDVVTHAVEELPSSSSEDEEDCGGKDREGDSTGQNSRDGSLHPGGDGFAKISNAAAAAVAAAAAAAAEGGGDVSSATSTRNSPPSSPGCPTGGRGGRRASIVKMHSQRLAVEKVAEEEAAAAAAAGIAGRGLASRSKRRGFPKQQQGASFNRVEAQELWMDYWDTSWGRCKACYMENLKKKLAQAVSTVLNHDGHNGSDALSGNSFPA